MRPKSGDAPETARGAPLLRPEAAVVTLRAVYLVALIGALTIAGSGLLSGDDRIATLGASCVATCLSLLLLSRPSQVKVAGILGTIFLLAIVLTAAATGYGIRDQSLPAVAFVILLANLVLLPPYTHIVTALATAGTIALAVAEVTGLLVTPTSQFTSPTSVVVVATVYISIAVAARRLVLAFQEGLQRASATEQGYQHIFNATTEAIFLVDPTTERIVDVNESAQTLLGYSRQEFLRSSLQILAAKHQSAEHVVEMMAAGMKGEPLLFEWTVTAKDGAEHSVEVSLRPTQIGSQEILLAVMRDATETRRVQAKLQESEKLQAVGQLAGGIAHDFNNQLTGILANASLLKEKVTDPRLKKCAEVIERCSRRSADLTAQLLAFARRGKHQNVDVDVQDLVAEVVELLKHTIDKRIVIKCDATPEPLSVLGDPTLLQNALLNLGLNARDAMPDGGVLSFSTHRHLIETTQAGLAASLSQGEYARVEISDTGCGMDEATLKRIFEPFFTTKEAGNGMGLAAVYGAVESHKGDITVESAVGKGTSFVLLLPLTEARKESVTFIAPLRHFSGTRVLLAEDEADVALATTSLLEELGCTVTHCRDGQEAVEEFSRASEAYDIVVVDHMMPRLSGREALRKMREVSPKLRAIITSGYSTEVVVENESSDLQHFLPKPFSQQQLSVCLGRVIEMGSRPRTNG